MCGRLDQNDIDRLIRNFAWAEETFNRSEAEPKCNVSPGSYRPVMHVDDTDLFIDDLHWGYRSAWARGVWEDPDGDQHPFGKNYEQVLEAPVEQGARDRSRQWLV